MDEAHSARRELEKIMKVVVNRCFGGFSLSRAALEYMAAKGHSHAAEELQSEYAAGREIARDDPLLVEAVEALGDSASGDYAELKVSDIPDGVEWQIEEYDGLEHIAERHRTWY